jgi:uncharacterized membrane protein YeaQ/YmgE (transglycosylase-associated protein family)
MAVVRRDEPTIRQLSTNGSYNVSLTYCITLGTYTLRREDGFPPKPNREAERLESNTSLSLHLSVLPTQLGASATHSGKTQREGKDKIMTLATLLLAAVTLSLSNVLWWLLVGLVAGFLASRVMRGGGYGLIGDIVVGLIGAFIGGWLAGFLGVGGSSSLIVTIVIAFIGACILLAILHAVTRGSSRGRLFGR